MICLVLMKVWVFVLLTIGLVLAFPGHGRGGQHQEHHGRRDLAPAPSNKVKRSPAPQFGILNLRLNETFLGNFWFQFRPNLGFLG